MLKNLILYNLILLASSTYAQCPKLIWSDEFDGTTLDLNKWSYELGGNGWGNNELQNYSASNTAVKNGLLTIIAKKENLGSNKYTSSRIRTKGKGDVKYGRFEARMKLPIGQGIWPAFWLLPTAEVYGGWPKSGEVDIMEFLGHQPEKIYGTIHFGPDYPNNKSLGSSFSLNENDFNTDFHEYALEWSENDIKWFIDGYLYATKTKNDLAGFKWPFDQKFHMLLNLAVGGNWPGSPNASTVFPQSFIIDYVRVYDMVGQPFLEGSTNVDANGKNLKFSIRNAEAGSSFKWTVPADVKIVKGENTNEIEVNWGLETGKIEVNVSDVCGSKNLSLVVKADPVLSNGTSLENFEDSRRIFKVYASGTFEEKVENPKANDINNSPLCGKYLRNKEVQYDVLVYNVKDIKNGADFVNGIKQFYMEVNSSAPIGTHINLQLENKALATSSYPKGRHSLYKTTTKKQNEWERLTFTLIDQPDKSVPNTSIDQMIFLFASNSFTNNTYYFDNINIYDKTTSIIDLNTDYEISIYPNPVSSELKIMSNFDIGKISCYNSNGQLQFSLDKYQREEIIDVSKLLPGQYHIICIGKNNIQREARFIIQK